MIRIVGMPGSPYSRKLRAVLRYRRIPHAWVHQGSPEARGLPQPRVPLLPQLILPGTDEAATDSTPLILMPGRAVRWTRGAVYAMGILSAFWCFERIAAWLA